VRRLTSVLTSLLLLHLTWVSADLACAKHGVHGGAQVSQPDASSHADHHAPAGPDAVGHADTACQVPTLPACCEALASCGMSIADERPAESGDLSYLTAGARSGVGDMPASWTLEPDPPPPKA
jgi:hypothetical protein